MNLKNINSAGHLIVIAVCVMLISVFATLLITSGIHDLADMGKDLYETGEILQEGAETAQNVQDAVGIVNSAVPFGIGGVILYLLVAATSRSFYPGI